MTQQNAPVSRRTLNGNTYAADSWHVCREDAMAAHWQRTEEGKRAFFTEVFPHRPVTLPGGVRHTGGWAVWVLQADSVEQEA